MKNLKKSIATLWIAIISFFSKVFGQNFGRIEDTIQQPTYWVSNPIPYYDPIFTTKKIVQRALIWATFIVWLINFIKIIKTKDKAQKKKRIKRTIITLIILLVTIFLVQLIVRRIITQINNTY